MRYFLRDKETGEEYQIISVDIEKDEVHCKYKNGKLFSMLIATWSGSFDLKYKTS